MFRNVLVLVVIAGLLAAFASGGSALFTSSATVDANTFTTGSVSISTNPSTALVTYANMAPGDKVTAPLVVSNNGSLDLRYAVISVATNPAKNLMSQLVLTIKSGVTTCTNAGFSVDGATLYTGVLGSLAPGTMVMGDSAVGFQPGDRSLAPAASETLCFNVTLPLNSGNGYQTATTTATFTFNAEQTANN